MNKNHWVEPKLALEHGRTDQWVLWILKGVKHVGRPSYSAKLKADAIALWRSDGSPTRLRRTDPTYTLRTYVHEHEPDHEAERQLVNQALRSTPFP